MSTTSHILRQTHAHGHTRAHIHTYTHTHIQSLAQKYFKHQIVLNLHLHSLRVPSKAVPQVGIFPLTPPGTKDISETRMHHGGSQKSTYFLSVEEAATSCPSPGNAYDLHPPPPKCQRSMRQNKQRKCAGESTRRGSLSPLGAPVVNSALAFSQSSCE